MIYSALIYFSSLDKANITNMKKQLSLIIICIFSLLYSAKANVGDTTWVQSFHGEFTQYGNFDTSVVFPDGSKTYRKIYMVFTLGEYNCPGNPQYCHQWDYTVSNILMTPGGDTVEMTRFITPYATSGTPGFSTSWQQHYIYDVTDYYPILKNSATMRVNYSGYSWGYNGDVKFAFIEGTPERNVLGHAKLWGDCYTYGNTASPIDSSVKAYTLTPPANTQSTEMKLIITGHGYDNTSGCCEFDNTGVGHSYTVVANNSTVAQKNMNINCGWSELYPQGGTWLYARAGNWCPGGIISFGEYTLPGVTASTPYSVDLNFDDTYNGGGSYGIYCIAASVFYYGGYNKTLDASLEDVIAPTNFEWYRRENPRVSVPVIKIRNTGGTVINSMLIRYGVKDSAQSQYIWTGSLASSADTVITLPAIASLTNLSLGAASGLHNFIATIVEVNGQADNDQSNDTLTSKFVVAPKWPAVLRIKLLTSSIGANGSFGTSPADASWQITDANNNVVASRTNANVSTTYYDTVTLNSSGFYSLSVTTSQCYGLQWWALAGQSGYTAGAFAVQNLLSGNAVLALNGTSNSGQYLDDFGCGFVQYFTTAGECHANTPTITRVGDTLTASSGAAFQWYNNGNAIAGATSQTYTSGTGNGNYTVEVTSNTGCKATSATFPFFNTGVNDLSALAAQVTLFPNPAHDILNIGVSAELTGSSYALYDMAGRRLAGGTLENEMNEISVRDIASGIYLVSIGNGINSISKRVIIQK